MDFDYSAKVKALRQKLGAFMDEFVYPNQRPYHEAASAVDRWRPNPVVEELKPKARAAGLWNLFLPESSEGAGLSNLEYAPLCEIMGRKWWTSGAMDPRCAILIFMGKTDPAKPDRYRQQSMVLVPRDTPGVRVLRALTVFGYDDAPHGHAEIDFADVQVPAANILLGEGRGFEIAQARLGPGRIHHCMRLIGVAEVGLELMCRRLSRRVAFGRPLAEQSVWLERIAQSRILIDQARLLTLNAAHRMDTVGNKAARAEIAMIKVAAPEMLCRVLDWAIQAHGAAGVSDDFPLAQAYAYARSVRIVDGPDEVHQNQIGRLELRKYETREPTAH